MLSILLYDARSIDIESDKCINYLMSLIDNFKLIIFPSFVNKSQQKLIINANLINEIKTEFENSCSTKLP